VSRPGIGRLVGTGWARDEAKLARARRHASFVGADLAAPADWILAGRLPDPAHLSYRLGTVTRFWRSEVFLYGQPPRSVNRKPCPPPEPRVKPTGRRRRFAQAGWRWILASLVAAASPPTVTPLEGSQHQCADSSLAHLKPFAGRWMVRAVFYRTNGEPEVWPGEARIEVDLRGCVLVEHLRTRRDSMPFEVLAVWGAHGGKHRFQRLMSHSQHGVLGLYEGELKDSTLYLEYVGKLPEGAGRLRHVVRRQTGDHFTFESQRSTRADTAWRVSWQAEYRRHPPLGHGAP
jgi:Protein of unknown function (DUF1579)